MLLMSFVLLLAINALQGWSARRLAQLTSWPIRRAAPGSRV